MFHPFKWSNKTAAWTIFLLAMTLRLLFILPKGNGIAVPIRDQNTYYALGRAIVDDGYLGPPTNQLVGPYYEFREKHPPPLGAIPEYRQKLMDRFDKEQYYYGVIKWGHPTSMFEPLYPLFSAGAYLVFGDRFFWHRFVLAIMSAGTCLFVYGIGRRLFNENTGRIAGLISAFYPYFIFYTVFLMSETFAIFFLAGAVYYFVRLKDEPGIKFAILFGLWLGLAFLNRSIILGLIPFFLLYLIFYDRKQFFPIFLSFLTFAMVILPWVYRNYRLQGEFILLSTRGGYNIWMRNNPYFYEDELKVLGIEIPQAMLDNLKYKEYFDFPVFSPEQNELERNRILTQEGMKFIRANPGFYAFLCWERFKTIIGFQGALTQGLIYIIVGILTFGIIFPSAFIAFFINPKQWRDTLPLIVVFLYFVGVYSLTHDGIRYRLPADPYIIILASFLFWRILDRSLQVRKSTSLQVKNHDSEP